MCFRSVIVNMIIFSVCCGRLAMSQVAGKGCQLLCNIDFEDVKLVNAGQFGFFNESRVLCWNTTATDRMIEIWGSGFGGVAAYSGNQFAELNANMVSTLFQRFEAGLGGSVEISFAHRGRAGTDVMSVEIGPEGGPYVNLGAFSAGNTHWEYHTLQYKFPLSGSSKYVLRFNSVSAAGGATVGNFLDAISIVLEQPKAFFTKKDPSCPMSRDGSIFLDSVIGSSPFILYCPELNDTFSTALRDLSAALYHISIIDFYGCEVSYSIALESHGVEDTIQVSAESCAEYNWELTGDTLRQSGNYFYNTIGQYGCDSVVKLQLLVHPQDTNFVKVTACRDYTWPVNGQKLIAGGRYSFIESNQFGCDSFILLDLILRPEDQLRMSVFACDSFYSTSMAKFLTSAGIYQDTQTNQFGCDSLIILDLQLSHSTRQDSDVTACEQWLWPGSAIKIDKSGDYIYHFTSTEGCDSLVTIHANILKSRTAVDSIEACETFSPDGGKHWFTESGIYSDTLVSNEGCDSFHIINLLIHHGSSDTLSYSSCDSMTLWQQTYYHSAEELVYLRDMNGCDSNQLLKIEIHPNVQVKLLARACDEFEWAVDHKRYNRSGTFRWMGQTSTGCDSLISLQLTIDSSFNSYDTVVVYRDSYFWYVTRQNYKEPGLYKFEAQTKEGCDSVHWLLLRLEDAGTVWLPNVFSPNGDLVNDIFSVISTPSILKIKQLEIFDRWGSSVFLIRDFPPNDVRYGWDGSFNGQQLNPAVFAWVLQWEDLNHEVHEERGNVTLVR